MQNIRRPRRFLSVFAPRIVGFAVVLLKFVPDRVAERDGVERTSSPAFRYKVGIIPVLSRLAEEDRQKVTTVMTDYQVSLKLKIGAVNAHKTTVARASRNGARRPKILDDAG
jgi:hypothetical protein